MIHTNNALGWFINGYLRKPGEGKLRKLGYHSDPVSRDNGLISTIGSKANVTGDERRQLRATTACTLNFTLPTLDQRLCVVSVSK